ncbi:Armadillo repeat-containing protein 8 [Podochytrium sp. JEL0797]|nr:Armadillo repeat-containing protein 8 [Podochytrium sp. JEL0797]
MKEAAGVVAVLASVSPPSNNVFVALQLCAAKHDNSLREASLRALKQILLKDTEIHKVDLLFIHCLVNLLSAPLSAHSTPSLQLQHSIRTNSLAATIMATLAASSIQTQQLLVSAGALPALLALLDSSLAQFHKMQEAALDAIAAIVKGSSEAGKLFVGLTMSGGERRLQNASQEEEDEMELDSTATTNATGTQGFGEGEKSVMVLLRLLKDARFPMTRLLAASCLSNIHRTTPLSNNRIPTHLLLPTLITLFSDPSTILSTNLQLLERATLVFADLVSDSEALQKLALEGHAVTKLAEILLLPQVKGSICVSSGSTCTGSATSFDSDSPSAKHTPLPGLSSCPTTTPYSFPSPTSTPSHKYTPLATSTLLALASTASLHEPARKQIMDDKLLPVIVSALSHPESGVRLAGCRCVLSLSRSVKNLRTGLMDAGVGGPVVELLRDSEGVVRSVATAVLCNVVLDFSPMKKTVLEMGGLERIVALLREGGDGCEVNAVWAVKNLVYQASGEVKRRVVEVLGWDEVRRVCVHERLDVKVQGMNLVRNLVCGGREDVEFVVAGFGEGEFVGVVEKVLRGVGGRDLVGWDAVLLQTLFVVVIVATGGERMKGLVVGSEGVMMGILKLMNHEKALIRLATVWCILNLTEPDDASPQHTHHRLTRLRSLGFLDQLKHMQFDSDPDVRGRVQSALRNLSEGVGLGGEAGPSVGRLGGGGGSGGGGGDAMDVDEEMEGGVMGLQGMRDLSGYLAGERRG